MNKLLPSVKSLITLAALLCFLFQASAASAQKVSLSVRNATVKAAIERLQKDYGYSFVIKTKDADVNKKITLDVKNEEIGAVVGKMFAGQNVVSSVEGKMIAIMSAPAKRDAAARASANAVVKGVVKDSAGNPITGATVIVDGTTIGATTDLDGSFSVRIGARTDVRLIVSYLGLKTREVAVDDPARFYEVRLENDNMALDEVVVVGYGTQRRSLVTNAISQFKPTEENMRSVMSPSELLQGRIAGVSISTSSGNLGSAEKMSIRGSSSLSASNEPLYVIDGIPLSNNSASLYSFGENMSSLATLNLTDTESIEVLKDAASAAIYGSRATNGVVLITTKQGREGKSEVKVNYGFSITQFPNTGRREYVGSKQYVEVFNEGVDNYNRQNGFTVNSSGYVKPIRNPYGDMPDTDWLDLITRLGQSHYLDLSFSGGNAKTKYYLSGSYNYQEGVIKTNDISKVNLKSNINHEMFKWLKVGANISGNYLHNNRIPGADLGSTIIGRAVQQRPFDRPYKPNGGYYTGGTDELLLHNAVQILSEETSYTDNYRFIGSFWAEAQIIKGLTAANIVDASAGLSEYAIESYFARLSLAYKDRYVVNATIRTDGSSRFAPDCRWGWFPSVSVGWNVSNESFWNAEKTDLKIRASYGRTGNQDGISNYGWQALISGGVNYGGQSGIAISSSGNDRLTWETADQYNAGFDLSFLGGKINMIADVYLKNTNNLLYSKPVHATTGETSILSNIGSMRNKGVEFTINTHLNLGKVLWSSSFNIARNVNKLTSLLEDDLLSIGANRALKLGRTVGSWYIFRTDGIYQYDGEVPQALYDKGVRAGDVKYWDRNGDGNITDDDRIVTGNPNPKFSGGWNNTFKYKGLELSLFFTYSYGNDVYASWMIHGSKPGYTRSLLKAYADNRWTGPGTSDKYPRAIYSYSGWNGKNSTMYLTDGSFIRLRSVTLGYTFPQRLVSKIHLKGLRVYAQGDNVFLCSRYPGWDPETSVNLDPRFYGEDNDGVPQPRIFKLGVNITF